MACFAGNKMLTVWKYYKIVNATGSAYVGTATLNFESRNACYRIPGNISEKVEQFFPASFCTSYFKGDKYFVAFHEHE